MSFFNRHHFFSQSVNEAESVEEFFGARKCAGVCPQKPWNPPADVINAPEGVLVRVEVTGLQSGDLQLRLAGSVLQITGIRRETCPVRKQSYNQMEIHYGPFERLVELPCPVDARKAEARYENGMIEVFFPKATRQSRGMMVIKISL